MTKKLMVIGAGLMGSGIAQVAAQAGWEVTLRELDGAATARGVDAVSKSLARFVSKGTITAEAADQTVARITTTTDLDAAADADIVVEAVFESIDVKRDVF